MLMAGKALEAFSTSRCVNTTNDHTPDGCSSPLSRYPRESIKVVFDQRCNILACASHAKAKARAGDQDPLMWPPVPGMLTPFPPVPYSEPFHTHQGLGQGRTPAMRTSGAAHTKVPGMLCDNDAT